ncbi:Os06g0278000 [Oryza sativa Japonica Group]|uniref:Os06g0278000 protein n=1 Tax=Oryza sativa subsp. japonica TaxID=39947 RepID=A0A0P0WVJ8_ORYSJ|nr:Os06g0278000 [Oryza sativa Japonica Group]
MAAARTWSRRGLVALLLLAMIFPSLLSPSDATSTYLRRRQVLKRLNKPPLATIQSPDGDIIDCVHISRQPAFDHPLLKDHTIQYGVAYATGDANYYGTKVTINVWQPTIATSGDFSLSQLWISAGSYDNKDLNTIETGWQVYPAMYGDDKTRLFIYWTRDAYNETGCYNLACSGFIQTNPQFVIGGSISPVSTYGDTQYEYDYLVWKDPAGGNWWLQVQGNNVGYWPSSIFTLLQTGVADSVEWGGEVNSPQITTPMGSGHFPEEGFGKATYSRAIQVVDSSNNLKPPNGVGLIAPLPSCYNVMTGSSSTTSWGTYIYYGGPGCPQNSQIEVM